MTGAEVMAGAAVASTAMTAYSTISAGSKGNAAASYNAAAAEDNASQIRVAAQANAKQAIEASESDAGDIRHSGELRQGEVRTAYGAGGVVATEGSPYELLLSNAGEIELEAQRRIYKGKVDARTYLADAAVQGNNLRSRAALDRMGAPGDAGYLQAGAGVLEGGYRAYKILGNTSGDGTGKIAGSGTVV